MFKISDYKRYLDCDMAITYKSLSIYPVSLIDCDEFFNSIACLTIDKDLLGPEFASMSYLEFLALLISSNAYEGIDQMFYSIARLCFLIYDKELVCFNFIGNGKTEIVINGVSYNKSDFNNIIKIILYQNVPDYDDAYVDPELAKALEEERLLKSRRSAIPSMQDQITALAVTCGFTFDYIYEMPIKRFFFALQKSLSKLEYQIARTAELSGTEFKSPIEDWMASKNKDKFVDERNGQYGSLKNKIST